MKRLFEFSVVTAVCGPAGLATVGGDAKRRLGQTSGVTVVRSIRQKCETTASATEFHGITVTCTEPGANEATYTVSYGTHSLTFTLKYPGAKCLVH